MKPIFKTLNPLFLFVASLLLTILCFGITVSCATQADRSTEEQFSEIQTSQEVFSEPYLVQSFTPKEPGDYGQWLIRAAKSEMDVTLRLINEKNEFIDVMDSNKIKAVNFFDKVNEQIVIFLASSSEMEPGSYRLVILLEEKDDSYLSFTSYFSIEDRDFVKEEIYLSRNLTSIRRNNSQQRYDEAIALQDLLNTKGTEIFHRGGFQYPIEERVKTSFYGDRRTYRYDDGTRASSIHQGIDYRGGSDTAITAPARARVAFADSRIVTGNTVILEHAPGLYTLYYHLSEMTVIQGQAIEEGEILGHAGATGVATGPHLHWEARFMNIPLDPEALIRHGIIMPH